MRRFGGSRGIGRTVGRAGSGGGVQEVVTNRPILNKTASSSNNNNSASLLSNLSLSSSVPVLAATSNVSSFFPPGHSSCSFFYDSDEWEWETIDGDEEDKDIGDENGNGFFDRLVFGQVPSMDEVEDVVTALKQVSSAGSQLDWIEPAMHVCYPRMLRSHGHERVYDAFHLLQTEPTIQKMVIALSTDKAVWNAVLSNEVVQEIKEAFYSAENDGLLKSGGNPDANTSILKLFLEKSKTKVMELIEKVSDLLSSIFQSQETEKDTTGTNKFEGNLRYSFMLSTLVLLIVILNRVYKA